MSDPKTALVVGLGRSGRAAAGLLLHQGWRVRGYDRSVPAEHPGFPCVSGDVPGADAFADVELVVLSPGVPPEPIREAAATHAPRARITGELALGLDFIQAADRPLPRTVLVTGTNGKSTVTALTGALLEAGGLETFTGGNLGIPLCEMLVGVLDGERAWPEAMVLECSSFQLETFEGFPTDVAMILNVTPDHLDRYDDEQDYARTKTNIFRGRKDGSLALLKKDAWTLELKAQAGAGLVQIIDGHGGGSELVLIDGSSLPRASLMLTGDHNALNAIFAVTAARHVGVSLADCESGLQGFPGLPHRMQFVDEIDGIAYFNDSKATNVASVVAGLGGLGRGFTVIVGGRAKGDSTAELLANLLFARANVIGIGELGPDIVTAYQEIAAAWRKDDELARAGWKPGQTALATDMDDAVRKAAALARPGEAVILSPGGSSFDMFRNYAERGDAFVAAVQRLRERG